MSDPILPPLPSNPPPHATGDLPAILIVGTERPEIAKRAAMLRAAGFNVLEAPDEIAALAAVRRSRPPVVVYDPRCHQLDRDIRSSDSTVSMLHTASGTGEVSGAEIDLDDNVEGTARQTWKMEALGQLTGGLAHDFNNLLTAIVGTLELLSMRACDDRMHRQIAIAQRAADRGAKLTEQLLAFSRRQQFRLQSVDLNALIGTANDLMSRMIGPGVTVTFQLAPLVWTVLADPTQLELVLVNLAINARDAMQGAGTLTISTANLSRLDPRLPIDVSGVDCVCLALRDTGAGMAEDTLAKAFEPFFTTKPPGQGSGLGLSQAYGIARQLGGTVRLSSELGSGTLVEMFLPKADPIMPAASKADTD